MTRRAQPHDIQAERAVLGSVLIEPDRLPSVAAILAPEQFYEQQHGRIFAAMVELYGHTTNLDLIALKEQLNGGNPNPVEGAYLTALMDGIPDTRNVEQYAKIVKAKAARRRLAVAGERLTMEAEDGTHLPAVISEVRSEIDRLLEPSSSAGLLIRSPHEVIAELANEGEPIPLGWTPLDRQMRGGGARAGRIIVLGGAPGSGKTTVLCQAALHLSLSHPVYTLFSDEGDEGAATRIGVQLGVGIEDIETHRAQAAQEIATKIGERSLYLVTPDSHESTPDKIVEHIARTHEVGGSLRAAVLLDSIQTVARLFVSQRDDSPRLAVERFMKAMRLWAIQYRLLFLLTSRSNRGSYRSKQASNNSEDMASFAESAAIEFDSDVALVFGLPDENTGVGKVRVAKNRLKGSMGSFAHRYDDQSGRMLEVDISASDEIKEQAKEAAHAKTVSALADDVSRQLAKRGPLSQRQIAELVGARPASVYEALRGLEAQGVATWAKGAKGANMWQLAQEGRSGSPSSGAGGG